MAKSALKNSAVKADVDSILEIAGRLGIELPAKTRSAAKLVPALRVAFEKRLESIPEDDWIRCEKCGEVTDDAHEIDRCPFCGDEGGDVEDEASGDAIEDAIEDATGQAPEEIDGVEAESDGDVDVEEPATVDLSADESGDALADESAEEPVTGESLAVVTVEGESIVAGDAEALETEKRIIVEASRDIRRKAYLLGKSLKRVFDGELWRFDGHTGFNKFIASLGVDHSMAYKLMEVVTEFTEEQVLEIGWTKLSIVARAQLPAEQREKAVERARTTPRRELAAGVAKGDDGASDAREVPEKEGPSNLDPLNDGTHSRGRPRKQDQEITLLTKVGGKPESHHFIDRATGKKVRKWHDNTYGEVRLSDNVSLFIAMRVDNGEIKGFSTAFRRVESDEERADSGDDFDDAAAE